MKKLLQAAVLLPLLLSLGAPFSMVFAQGTAFTYQGLLNSGSNPANGTYDFVFTIYGSPAGTNDGFANQTNSATPVSNGLFTVTLDLGQPGIFTGPDRWLEIAVRTNSNGAFTILAPRQKLTPTPYAITAGNVVSNGLAAGAYGSAVTFNNAGNSFSGDGSELANVNALTVGGLGTAGFWHAAGNLGTTAGSNYLGTADNQPLELHVNGVRALRIEPTTDAPNLIGGAAVNFVAPGVVGAVIAGGGGVTSLTNSVSADFGVVSGGDGNTIQINSYSSTISGGQSSTIQFSAPNSTIGGGAVNTIRSGNSYSTIGGGVGNTIESSASSSTIGGGGDNTIETNAGGSTIGGGEFHTIPTGANFATIPGGYFNVAAGNFSFAAGQQAQALHLGSFVWADSQNAAFSSTASNQFLLRAAGGVGINTANPLGTAFCVNGDARLDAQALGYNEGLALNFPTNMSASGGYGGIHFHSTARNGAFDANSIKWGMFYNYAPGLGGIGGGGLAIAQNNATTRLYFATNGSTTFYSNPGQTAGVTLAAGGGAWTTVSDRNAKENFHPVNTTEVLEKVAALPLTTWNYKSQDARIHHLGPMAQDFKVAFGLGESATGITTVDEEGVALAAIQGLNQKLGEKDAEIRALKTQNDSLAERLNQLEATVKQLAANK